MNGRYMLCAVVASLIVANPAVGQVAVRGETVYTMAGKPIQDGMVVIRDGKIAAVGKADVVQVPDDCEVLCAKIVTPKPREDGSSSA